MSTRTRAPRAARALLCGAVAVLAGCATPVDVRSIGTGAGEPPAFQLRGGSLAALDAQTKALCPTGHQVLRQWQKLHRQSLAPQKLANWVAEHGSVQDTVSYVLDEGEAQMTVQCQPAVAAPVAAASSATSAP